MLESEKLHNADHLD